ncbi:MAG TPA: histidine phosphatase family protein [Candidatus Dormibacteraeota bacterium]|nr:histidine phosphatase family protein [Candidatus Dormibacteraeota bacterium]
MADIRLHLLRHAHAGDPTKWRGPDAERPLSAKGIAQAERLGELLARAGFRPDLIVTSPKVRAEQTARIVAEALGLTVSVDERLASGFAIDELEALLEGAGRPAAPVLVGHDPDFSELLGDLIGSPIQLRKGALARVDVAPPFDPESGVLRWLVPPDLLVATG